jgi:hypothetical protein
MLKQRCFFWQKSAKFRVNNAVTYAAWTQMNDQTTRYIQQMMAEKRGKIEANKNK